jgi:hypothetical protein
MRLCIALFACCLYGQPLDLLWKQPLGRAAAGPPVVFDGGAAVTLTDGRIVFVNAAGSISGSARMDQAAAGPALVQDGFVFGVDVWGSVYKFRLSGERVWKYERESRAGSGYNSPVLAFGGVIFTDTRGHLYLIGADGRLRMEVSVTSYRLSTPTVGDLDGDGTAEIVFGADDGVVYCVSEAGLLLWERKVDGARLGRAMPVADGNQIYVTTPFVGKQTGLHALGKWYFRSEMQTYASIMLADLDGDGTREILFGDKNTRLYALNAQGKQLWSTQLGGRGIFHAGAVAGDWIYQIVRDTGLDGKSLYVLDKQGNVRASVAMDGGGGYGPALAGDRLLAVSGNGTLHCYRTAGGPPQWASWRNGPANTGYFGPAPRAAARPAPAAAPGERRVAVRGTNDLPASVRRSARVLRPDGVVQVRIGKRTFGVDLAGDYLVFADGATTPVLYRAEDTPLALRAPPGAFGDAVAARLRAEHEFARKHPSVERFDALRAQMQEAEQLFALAPAGDVLIRQLDNPWDDRPVFMDGLSVHMLGNEYESIAVQVTNLRPETAQVRVSCDARYVDIREPLRVRPESTGRLTEDVLPRLNEAGTLTLAAGESRKLWIITHSRDLAAGTHTALLRAGDMWSLRRPAELPLRVHVSKARLPDQRVYQQCNWLYLASIADPAAREATIVDALSHGMTVFPIPSLAFPLEGSPDSALHDSLIARLKGKATFLVSGSVGGPLAARDFAAAIRKYSAHMLALGLSFNEWAFYVMDEPGLMGKDAAFDKYAGDIARIKQADPRVRIYANPAGGARPEMLEPLTRLIDIWQPDLHLVREQPEAYRRIFQTGTYWHYEAGADQRNLDTLGYYRLKPWVAFQMGMTGGGYWVYSASNFWSFDPALATEYGTVYQTPRGPVTTKRWEASRDGTEDFELLWQVRKLATAKRDAAALRLLDQAVAYVTAGQENVSDISRQVEPFTPGYARWMQYRSELVQAWERML